MGDLLTVLYFIYGLIIGSFLNVCIDRLPLGQSIAKGRSSCQHCQTQLRAWDLIPVVSWLLLRGHCRYCDAPISKQYPLIELLTGLLFALAYIRYGLSIESILSSLLFALLIVLSAIDIKIQEIPDQLNIMILLLGFIFCFLTASPSLTARLMGLICVSLPLWLIAVVTNGGIGGGDIKLMASSGFLLGWQSALLAFLIGCVTAAAIAIYLLMTKKCSRQDTLAFGPFLALGIIIATLWGDTIIFWYIDTLPFILSS